MKAQKLKHILTNRLTFLPLLLISLFFVIGSFALGKTNSLSTGNCSRGASCQIANIQLTNGCGSQQGFVQTSIDFGCNGNTCGTSQNNPQYNPTKYCEADHNGIVDLLFAIIRFLSDGVGLVVIVSVIIGGIQYITSRGEPSATQTAVKRLTSALTALIIYIFAYAILNYVIPFGLFKQ